MLTRIKAMILADLWAQNVSTVALDERLSEKKGYILSFLSDETKLTLPDETLKRIAKALSVEPSCYFDLISPTEPDVAHVYLQHKCKRIPELTKNGNITWNPIAGISLRILNERKHIIEVVENEEFIGRIKSLEGFDEVYAVVGPTFVADIGEWKFYLTCTVKIDEDGDAIGPLTINAYTTDSNNHLQDYLEGDCLIRDENLGNTTKTLEELYRNLMVLNEIPLEYLEYPL